MTSATAEPARDLRTGTLLVVAAAVLAVLSLGLPWGATTATTEIPGWFVPGSCVTVYGYDGYASSECTSGTFSPSMTVGGGPAAAGFAHPARVPVLAGAVLVLVGLRRRDRRLAWGGVAVGALALALGGLAFTSGRVALLLALGLAAVAVRLEGQTPS